MAKAMNYNTIFYSIMMTVACMTLHAGEPKDVAQAVIFQPGKPKSPITLPTKQQKVFSLDPAAQIMGLRELRKKNGQEVSPVHRTGVSPMLTDVVAADHDCDELEKEELKEALIYL